MFTRLLVPLDGSPESNTALPPARTVALATGGSVVLLRACFPSENRATIRRVWLTLHSH